MKKENTKMTIEDLASIVAKGFGLVDKKFGLMATKEDLKGFATKEDIKELATKEDLKREVSWLRDDIKGLTADLSGVPSKKEFNKLKEKVDKYLSS